MNEQQRAEQAARLLADEALRAFLDDAREQELRAFAGSGREDIARREEAYATIHALNKFTSTLQAAVKAWEQKEKKRGG